MYISRVQGYVTLLDQPDHEGRSLTSVRSYTLPSMITQQSSAELCFWTSEYGIKPCCTD